jgi:hypothetical protein
MSIFVAIYLIHPCSVFRKPKAISAQVVCDILLVYIFVKRYHNNRWQMCHLTKLEACTYNGPHTLARPSQTAMMLLTVTWSDGGVSGLRECCDLSVGTLSPTAQAHAIRRIGPDGGGSALPRNVGNRHSTRRNGPEDLSPRQHCCENVKSRTVDPVSQESDIRLIELWFWKSFGHERTSAGENYVMWFQGRTAVPSGTLDWGSTSLLSSCLLQKHDVNTILSVAQTVLMIRTGGGLLWVR